jgi:rhodanese-related sulfurtransferase
MKNALRNFAFLMPIIFSSCCKKQAFSGYVGNKNYERKINQLITGSVPVISTDELKKIHSEVIIFDARNKTEYETSRIPDAYFLDDAKISLINTKWKNKTIVVYCSVGYRSEKAAEKLKKAGFNDVRNLYGGIFEWINNRYEVEDFNKEPVNKIHTYNKKWSVWIENNNYQKIW